MLSFFCQPCDREFTTIAGRIRHQETAVVHKNAYCNPCDRLFVHWNALSSHLVHSDAHDYCSICEVHFDDRSELNDHTAVEHPTCCGRKFKNQLGLHEHLRQADKHAGRYCVEHKRLFDTKGNLETHLKSKAHVPRKYERSATSDGESATSDDGRWSFDEEEAPMAPNSLRFAAMRVAMPQRVKCM